MAPHQKRRRTPTVRNASAANSVQIYEVEFLGYASAPPPQFLELISTDVEVEMFGQRTSAYLRVPFAVQTNQPLDWLALCAHYDGRFVAFLNGVPSLRLIPDPESERGLSSSRFEETSNCHAPARHGNGLHGAKAIGVHKSAS